MGDDSSSSYWHCGNRLWLLRRHYLRWSQEELARRAELSVDQIERAESRAKTSFTRKLAHAFDVNENAFVDYLTGLLTPNDLLATRKAA